MTAMCHIGTPMLANLDWGGLAGAGIFIAMLLFTILWYHRAQTTKRGVFDKLEAMGFEVLACPSDVQKYDAYQMLGRPLGDGLHGVAWVARGRISERLAFVIEHVVHMKHHGRRGVRLTTRTFAVTSCPAGWPRLELTETHLGDELLCIVGIRRTQHSSSSREFSKRWRVSCDDSEFAGRLLNERVTAFARSLPRNSGVLIGAGRIVISTQKLVRPDEVQVFSTRPAEFLSLLPPELDEYQSPAGA